MSVCKLDRPGILKCRGEGHIAIGYLLHEFWIRIVEHDVKMLDGMDTLQTFPVFEPYDLLGI